MALIVITIEDGPEGNANVAVQSNPGIDTKQPYEVLTQGQILALNMLNAAVGDSVVQQDRGLLQLLG